MVEPLDLSALIPEMSGLVRPSIPKKIAFSLDLDSDLPAIEADRGQVQQVFMNLTLNASEALGSHGGLISVRTYRQDVDEYYLRLHSEAAALRLGKYVCLEVRDTGWVLQPSLVSYAATRARSLSTARRAKGVASRCCSQPSSKRPGKRRLRVATTRFTAPERSSWWMMSRSCESWRSPAAIDVFKRHPGEIALVVLDLSMPNMSGEEALPELRKIRPGVKVVVSSGYSEAETMILFQGQPVSGFVQKPYTSKGLAEKVKASLG